MTLSRWARPGGGPGWGGAASLSAHGLVLGVLVWTLAPARPPEPSPPLRVALLWAEPSPAEAARPAPAEPPLPGPPTLVPAPPDPPGWATPAPPPVPPLPPAPPLMLADLPAPPPPAPPAAAPEPTAEAPRPAPRPAPAPRRTATPAATPAANAGAGPAGPSSPPSPDPGFRNIGPAYPELARQRGQEGVVVLELRVSAEGRVLAAEVAQSSGHPMLDAAAQRAAQGWRFRPALEAGRPVEARLSSTVRFRLD